MPKWVPVLIGVVLVVIAALAVFTGLRYRNADTLTDKVTPQRERVAGSAPPEEPGAGASLVPHGAEGETVPAANEPVQGGSRAIITGGRGGVQSTVRMWARRGMVFNVLPDDAMVYVNNVLIGEVRQFNTMDEVYDFAQPGSYTVRIVSPRGGSEKTFVVTASDDAKVAVARISAKL
jgi:hypothetical protein